jgi:thioredoxin-related protein
MKAFNYKYAAAFLILLGVFALAYYFTKRSITPGPPVATPIVWKSFNDGIDLARSSNKKVLVDVYTDWCTWCKKMDSEVYANKKVIGLLNEHFIAVKLNAESANLVSFKGNSFTEADLSRQLGVSGYPTTLFFDQNSNPITDLSGYAAPDRFARVLDFIGKDYYKTISFQEYVKNQPSPP